MKNRLLPLFVVLATFSARSQVGIGTKTPNSSAQLEITTVDLPEADRYGKSTKGILIPRVELTSTKVYAPIVGKPTNSLLVFNTKTTGDVTPGYYFWLVDKWNRLAVSGEAGSGTGKDGKVGLAEGTGIEDNQGVFLKMFKRKFKEEFEFSEDSFLLENGSKPKDFERSIFVVYDKSELIDFLKLEKKGTNVMVCFFNKHLHNSLLYFNEIKNLKLVDASKSRNELLKELKSYFKDTSDFISKIPEIKFSNSTVNQTQLDSLQKALFFMAQF
ncbi:hypothetical protein [Flavobacterium sp. UBA7680]|uniref:hypothetical protein n=1 Tax=Flavobacterium sp. UBA7680 TaxID=1946559 RepID=UPI0025BDAC23|nr:hypothetical protein [Flavobacterium sp. UBA7680]